MFDALFGNNMPNAPGVDLDPGTKGLINNLVQQGMGSNQATTNKLNAGVSESGNQFSGGGQNTGETGSNATQLQAIRNLYGGVAGKNISNILKSNQMNVPIIQGGWMDQAAKYSMAQDRVSAGIQERLMNANNDYQIARAGALAGAIGAIGGPLAQGFGRMSKSKPTTIGGDTGGAVGEGYGSDVGGSMGADMGGSFT